MDLSTTIILGTIQGRNINPVSMCLINKVLCSQINSHFAGPVVFAYCLSCIRISVQQSGPKKVSLYKKKKLF